MSGDLLKRLEDGMSFFSKGQRSIAAYVLTHYDKAAYLTAARLGALVGVSESTVVRFATELGFSGYPEMQAELKKLVRSRLTSFQRIEVTNTLIGDGDVLDTVLLSDVDKIRNTMEEIDHDSFERAVDAIASAKNIYVIGVRSSSALAGFLSHSLGMVFDHVRLVQTSSGNEVLEQIINVGEGDVMVAISFPRYSKRVIKAVEYARSRNADVVALTDSENSPIAPFADQLLIAQSDMASFVDSLVAPLSIVNAMVVAVARKRQEEVSERLRILEEVWDRYDVYDKK